MALEKAEYEAALDAAERHLLARGSGVAVKRISHTGETTARESELDNMSIPQLKQHIAWLERKVGKGCSRRPIYP